jgi:uncharacterized metal-binding protein YceD (DUF177 family)
MAPSIVMCQRCLRQNALELAVKQNVLYNPNVREAYVELLMTEYLIHVYTLCFVDLRNEIKGKHLSLSYESEKGE